MTVAEAFVTAHPDHAGTGALNVIPGTIDVHFNFRFSTARNAVNLQSRARNPVVAFLSH